MRLHEAAVLAVQSGPAQQANGVATWEAFRVPADHGKCLSVSTVVERARRAADRAGTTGTHQPLGALTCRDSYPSRSLLRKALFAPLTRPRRGLLRRRLRVAVRPNRAQ